MIFATDSARCFVLEKSCQRSSIVTRLYRAKPSDGIIHLWYCTILLLTVKNIPLSKPIASKKADTRRLSLIY